MGVLDPSYSLFVNTTRTALLCFKVCNQVAIVSGDPMSAVEEFDAVLTEFQTWRQRHRLGLAFMGTSERMVEYAQQQHQHQHQHHQPPKTSSWTILEFGRERVLNPTTNPVLLEQDGKRIRLQTKQLLHPAKGGITLDIYIAPPSPSSPSTEADQALQTQLSEIYTTWRHHRNTTPDKHKQKHPQSQAFITTYTPFTQSQTQPQPQMLYIYTRAPTTGTPTSLAALRALGTGPTPGYHLDPCVAAPGAPKGLADLLVFAAMALLRRLGCSYLSLGLEPSAQLGRVAGVACPVVERLLRAAYRVAFARLPVQGKRAYHDKFRPDAGRERGVFLVFVREGGYAG
ncbi:hypothetical protein BP00DRAFT_307590, partial [Aspergillus indologenus CBS 114.80]